MSKAAELAEFGGGISSGPNAVDGLAKAWSNINGTGTIASYDSLNISSISDSNTGHYQIDVTNAMNDTNYGVTTGGSNSLTGFVGRVASPVNTKTSSAYGIETINNAGSAHEDYVYIMTVVNGDLA
jgi:hypothetical protein